MWTFLFLLLFFSVQQKELRSTLVYFESSFFSLDTWIFWLYFFLTFLHVVSLPFHFTFNAFCWWLVSCFSIDFHYVCHHPSASFFLLWYAFLVTIQCTPFQRISSLSLIFFCYFTVQCYYLYFYYIDQLRHPVRLFDFSIIFSLLYLPFLLNHLWSILLQVSWSLCSYFLGPQN